MNKWGKMVKHWLDIQIAKETILAGLFFVRENGPEFFLPFAA